MWLGTRGGISYLDRDKQNFRVINEANNDDHSLNNGEVYAFWEDRTANRLWIGTESGGINILDNESGRMSYITKKNGLTSNCVKCFFLNGDEVWVGTYLGGIVVLDATTGKVKRVFRNREGDNSSLIRISYGTYTVLVGVCLDCNGKGLDLYDRRGVRFPI
jgi:ligand-binding sensor domain-containing protein